LRYHGGVFFLPLTESRVSENDKQAMSAAKIVMAALAVPIIIGVVAVVISLTGASGDEPVVSIEVLSPGDAIEGELVEVTLVIKNDLPDEVALQSIAIANAFYDGYALTKTSPTPTSRDDGDMFQTFAFDLRIGPGEEARVSLAMTALNAGVWAGDIDVRLSSGTQVKFIRGEVMPGNGPASDGNDTPLEIVPAQE